MPPPDTKGVGRDQALRIAAWWRRTAESYRRVAAKVGFSFRARSGMLDLADEADLMAMVWETHAKKQKAKVSA